MTALVFLLLGLPAAYIANRLIARLTEVETPEDEDDEDVDGEFGHVAAKRLPWQQDAWPARVRLLCAALVPPLMAFTATRFDLLQATAVSALLIALMVCTATDLLRYRVPNAVTYPGTALAILAALIMPGADLSSALLAAVLGGTVFLVMAIVSRGGLGLGDVKLAVLIGAALGLPAAYQALAFGIVFGGLVILLMVLTGIVGRKQAVPYAPFLALSAIAMVLLHGAAFAPL